MVNTETKARAFRKSKSMIGGDRSGLSRLEVPASWPNSTTFDEDTSTLEDLKQATTWRTVVAPKDIEFLLKSRNRRHFGQAETKGTPMTTPRMKRQFNWSATTKAAELVLEGDYEDDELDSISQLMLDDFTRVTDLDSLPQYITMDEF